VLALLKKGFTTETQRARRRKKGRFGVFFSVNLYHSLCVLRVSVVFSVKPVFSVQYSVLALLKKVRIDVDDGEDSKSARSSVWFSWRNPIFFALRLCDFA